MSSELKHQFLSTEKSFSLQGQNKIVLVTPHWITQSEITNFIETKFSTKVLKINSLIKKGKTKFRKKIKVTLPNKKKFYVTVADFSKFEKTDDNNA